MAIIVATSISILLVAAVVRGRLETPATLGAVGNRVGAVVANTLTRTRGFLGFEEAAWTTEATVAKAVELVATALLVLSLLPMGRRPRPRPRQPA